MRRVLALISALFLVVAAARGADYTDTAALDELFAQLGHSQSAAEADGIAAQIWAEWLHPDDPELARRMTAVANELAVGDIGSAHSGLDAVVGDYPTYAEGWNQRATVEYMINDYVASLADIDKVLALEPRHFGALSGRVMIELKQGRRADALRDMMAALRIHPYLSGRELFPELSEKVTHV